MTVKALIQSRVRWLRRRISIMGYAPEVKKGRAVPAGD